MRLNADAWQQTDASGTSSLVPTPSPPTSANRRLEIDTLRGLACMLLVNFHVVGLPYTGLRLSEFHGLVLINEVLYYLRMPLFSFISGYIYATRPFSGDARHFIAGKTRRLLLPMLTMGTLFALVQRVTPGTNDAGFDSWWMLHIMPVGHFWFLEALFLIFLMIVALESTKLLNRPLTFWLVYIASAAIFVFARPPVYLGIAGAFYLFPFFLAGLACRRFDICSLRVRWLATALFAAAAVWLLLKPVHDAAGVFAGLLVSVSLVFLLLKSGWQVRWLAYVGGFSFAVYLMHVFFTAASRLFFTAIGVSDPYLHTLLGMAAGVLGPIAAASVISRSARLELWLLGQSRPRSQPCRPASTSPRSI